MLLLDKQKDKPDPDVLLELASYYDLTPEAMMKKVLEVRVNFFYLHVNIYTHSTGKLVLEERGTSVFCTILWTLLYYKLDMYTGIYLYSIPKDSMW